MLAFNRAVKPSGPAWAWEMKWDGVRAIATVANGEIELFNRRLLPVTHRYPELVHSDPLHDRRLVLDGEIVATDDDGRPSFQLLQSRMHLDNRRQIAELSATVPASFMVFDVMHLDGESLLEEPYTERRAALASLAAHGLPTSWHAPAHNVGDPTPMWDIAEQYGLEGVVAKRLDSRYEPGRRSGAWVKVKRTNRAEMVVGGWLGGLGRRAGRVGSLAVGYYSSDAGPGTKLQYAGKVGSGLAERDLDAFAEAFARIATDESPFAVPVERGVHFVQPLVVVEVRFTEWTDLGTMRHPVYMGVRTDKTPTDVHRE
ncbi:MAG TPA: non-homologous end-joining DNA ligase [Acidimicrobiia bacterium]